MSASVESRNAGSSQATAMTRDSEADGVQVHRRGPEPTDDRGGRDPDGGGDAERQPDRPGGEAVCRERERDEQARDATDDTEQSADERRARDRAVVADEAERRAQAGGSRAARRSCGETRSARRAEAAAVSRPRAPRTRPASPSHRRAAPAITGPTSQPAPDAAIRGPVPPAPRPPEAARAGPITQRIPKLKPKRRRAARSTARLPGDRLPDESSRHQSRGEEQRHPRAEPVCRVADRHRDDEHRQRRRRQEEPELHRAEAEVVPDGGKERHERRLGDAVDERECEEDAELEVEALHANSIVTADRFVKCELMDSSIKKHDRLAGVEIRHLAALEAVVRTGSFGRAGVELGYSQSAISQQIATLERAAGLQLLNRPGGRRPVTPTDAGQRLLRHARRASAAMRAAEADLHALARG